MAVAISYMRCAMLYLSRFPALQLASVRRQFYSRWGHEPALVEDVRRRSYFRPWPQPLSLKLVDRGQETYIIDGRRYVLDPDNILVTSDAAVVASEIAASRPVRSLALFAAYGQPADLLQLLSEDRGRRLPTDFTFTPGLRPRTPMISAAVERLQWIVREQAPAAAVELAWLRVFQALLDQELRIRGGAWVFERRRDRRWARSPGLLRARELLEQRYADELPIEELAAAAHLSRFHFARAFAAAFGVSPSEYLVRKRLRAAIRSLQTGAAPVTTLAESVGYQSRVTLYRHLRRRTGLTLTQVSRDESLAERALALLAIPHDR